MFTATKPHFPIPAFTPQSTHEHPACRLHRVAEARKELEEANAAAEEHIGSVLSDLHHCTQLLRRIKADLDHCHKHSRLLRSKIDAVKPQATK